MVMQEDIDVRITDEAGEIKGRLDEKREMAKAMFSNVDVSMISNISGLSEKEIRLL